MIEIVDYKEAWPREFAQIAAELHTALGDLAVRIDHIGSTSVPGLAAKDIIDLQVTVPLLECIDQVQAALGSLGYVMHPEVRNDHRPPGATGPETDWEKRLFKPPPAQRPTNLHLRVSGRPNQRYALLFRDYLRAHPASAAAYEALKRRLARYLDDTRTYAFVKDPACDLIMAAAEVWAAATAWQPEGE